jgi:Protein of unknown function (DUF1403)
MVIVSLSFFTSVVILLRAKGAGAVIETLLDEDAVLPSARRGAMSDRGLRRLFDVAPILERLWGPTSSSRAGRAELPVKPGNHVHMVNSARCPRP